MNNQPSHGLFTIQNTILCQHILSPTKYIKILVTIAGVHSLYKQICFNIYSLALDWALSFELPGMGKSKIIIKMRHEIPVAGNLNKTMPFQSFNQTYIRQIVYALYK